MSTFIFLLQVLLLRDQAENGRRISSQMEEVEASSSSEVVLWALANHQRRSWEFAQVNGLFSTFVLLLYEKISFIIKNINIFFNIFFAHFFFRLSRE
jgi:hypothetical protein